MRRSVDGLFYHENILNSIGLSSTILRNSIEGTYDVIDRLDQTLLETNMPPLCVALGLVSLSGFIGASLVNEIIKCSGKWRSNGSNTYPDLLAIDQSIPDIEMKVALEGNKPKGHHPKRGWYCTSRYVLCASDGTFLAGKNNRGVKPYIWELRVGHLDLAHFSISNTDGDSAKTACVNKEGMNLLKVVYEDPNCLPIRKLRASK